MPKYGVRYQDEDIIAAVAASISVRAVMLSLGMPESGGARQHLNQRIRSLELDTSHFVGQSARRGVSPVNRRNFEEVLVRRDREKGREDSAVLRRAMLESGILYQCGVEECPTRSDVFWEGITLEIDHKNGDAFDNCRENLWFLCPNCHSQQPTSSHSWKNSSGFATQSICACGKPKRRASKQCSSCYQEARKSE